MNESEHRVIIVGAGLAGICVACYLAKNNIPYLLVEKSARVGGIWSALDFPGIRCDTEILNYSYSFDPLLASTSLVDGETISGYLQATADKFGIVDNIRFNTRVSSASYSGKDHHWRLATNRGSLRARFLVNTNGYFEDQPYLPQFSGSECYTGAIRHLFDTNRHTDFDGKRVVLVGSGASAISAAPALAARCRKLTLLQRSPSWIYQDDNRIGRFTSIAQCLYRAGFRYPVALLNWLQQCKSDLVFVAFRKLPWLARWFFRQHWRGSVSREAWREHFRPRYNPWEQRIPVGLGFRQLLTDPKFDLVTGQIARFDAHGARLADGRNIEADVFVFATGFNLNFFRFTVALDDQPVDTRGINFYKSMMMGGLPNYFQPFGPPHTSFTRRVETISRLIVKIIQHMQQRGLESVSIPRQAVAKRPRITPNYVMRKLDELPAFHGSLELPSIDNLLFYRFNPGDYQFYAGHKRTTRTAGLGQQAGIRETA
jgi:cation diffusion facilitator CzcD-associated flavoprotein CzcO